MKESMASRNRESVVVIFSIGLFTSGILLSSVSPGSAISYGKTRLIDSVGVVTERISYSGKDEYRIEIALMNKHAQTLSLREFDRQWYIQTEKGWRALEETVIDGPSKGKDFPLPASGKKGIVSTVRIPLTIPDLFRTYEGDISLLFRYRLGLTGGRETVERESLYWIRPMTDRWVEREGM